MVGVGFSSGTVAGVEVGRDFSAGGDADAGGKFGVEGGNPVKGVHVEVMGGGEVGDLSEGVNTSICAASSVDTDGFFGDFSEGVLDLSLDGIEFWLNLPTTEGGSIVGDREF